MVNNWGVATYCILLPQLWALDVKITHAYPQSSLFRTILKRPAQEQYSLFEIVRKSELERWNLYLNENVLERWNFLQTGFFTLFNLHARFGEDSRTWVDISQKKYKLSMDWPQNKFQGRF